MIGIRRGAGHYWAAEVNVCYIWRRFILWVKILSHTAHTAFNQAEILQILDINVHVKIINIKKNSTNISNFTLIFKSIKSTNMEWIPTMDSHFIHDTSVKGVFYDTVTTYTFRIKIVYIVCINFLTFNLNYLIKNLKYKN